MKKFILIALAVLPIMAWAQAPDGQKGQGGQAPQGVQTVLGGQAPQGTSNSNGSPSALGGAPLGGKIRSAYQTIIYTDDRLPDSILVKTDQQDRKMKEFKKNGTDPTRGLFSDLGESSLSALKGIGSGYVTSIVSMGAEAVASLITRKTRLKEEWMKTVQAENTWSQNISAVEDVKDFYSEYSMSGALDPKGMHFVGIGCLQMDKNGKDTLFFVACHIDPDKLYRIIYHSKFELVLDTLIISPQKSNLPNSSLQLDNDGTDFFKNRKDFKWSMNIKLTSSWITDAIELHTDEQLGEFSIELAINQDMLDKDGFFRYQKKTGETSRYKMVGESFIVPRSFIGYRDNDDNYYNIWGTGQYKFSIELKETCNITDDYLENWNEDRKERNRLQVQQEQAQFGGGGPDKDGKQKKNSKKFATLKKLWQEHQSQNPDLTPEKMATTIIKSLGEGANKAFGLEQDEHEGGMRGGGMPKK